MAKLQIKKSFMLVFSIILMCLITLIITLLIISPGKLKPFVDQSGQIPEGSISEKTSVKIGGVDQGMFIRGKDIKNPVLLFVHGGPSFPEYFAGLTLSGRNLKSGFQNSHLFQKPV